MKKIYGIPGHTMQVTAYDSNYTPEEGAVLMHGPRPTPNYAAQADGTWAIPQPSLNDQITALQSRYAEKLRSKIDEINVAVALDDTDALADKRAEYAALVTEQKTAVDALILGGAV